MSNFGRRLRAAAPMLTLICVALILQSSDQPVSIAAVAEVYSSAEKAVAMLKTSADSYLESAAEEFNVERKQRPIGSRQLLPELKDSVVEEPEVKPRVHHRLHLRVKRSWAITHLPDIHGFNKALNEERRRAREAEAEAEAKAKKEHEEKVAKEVKSHKRRSRSRTIWGNFDEYVLPSIENLTASVPESTPNQGRDFNGQLIDLSDMPKLNYNSINGKNYLIWIYVNYRSLRMGLNAMLSLRPYGLHEVLFLCEEKRACDKLQQFSMPYYYPKALIDSIPNAKSYWGPSMWVRSNFNYIMVNQGINVANIDADTVFVDDPRDILFHSDADFSISFNFRRYFPWVWSFPLLNYVNNSEDRSEIWWMREHYVEINNAIVRYDSTAAMKVFWEAIKHRMKIEMEETLYTGWDQSSIGRVMYEGKIDLQDVIKTGNSKSIMSNTTNLFGIKTLVFQVNNAKFEQFQLTIQPHPFHVCHALGDVRNASNAWRVKEMWLTNFCCFLIRDDVMTSEEKFSSSSVFSTWAQDKKSCNPNPEMMEGFSYHGRPPWPKR